jgi:hypothetical protein
MNTHQLKNHEFCNNHSIIYFINICTTKNVKDNFTQTLSAPEVTFKKLYYENMATVLGE